MLTDEEIEQIFNAYRFKVGTSTVYNMQQFARSLIDAHEDKKASGNKSELCNDAVCPRCERARLVENTNHGDANRLFFCSGCYATFFRGWTE